jgi:hypothetical protein
MDEPQTDRPQPEKVQPEKALKEWLTPELIFEEVSDITRGGTGRNRNLATEDKVTTYYHS